MPFIRGGSTSLASIHLCFVFIYIYVYTTGLVSADFEIVWDSVAGGLRGGVARDRRHNIRWYMILNVR